jgi:hypothetical protein
MFARTTMTPLVWANFPLVPLFLLARADNPLRMTLRNPDTAPDFAAAHA